MKFFHFLTYAIVLGFFAVACTTEPQTAPTAHIDSPQNSISKNRLLDTELLPAADVDDSLVDQMPQH